MPTKNLDQKVVWLEKKKGTVSSGVILQPDLSRASDAPVPPGMV